MGREPSMKRGEAETESERLDRSWGELLQELRVIQAGTQIITGFLLAAAFQSRFEDLDLFQRNVYLGLVVASILTTVTALTPVTLHRYLSQMGARDDLVRFTTRFVSATLFGVAITVSGIGLLIFDFVMGRAWGIPLSLALMAIVIVVWVVIPRVLRHRAQKGEDAARAERDPNSAGSANVY